MQRLTGLDAAFLQLETPTNHMHVMAVAVLDPSAVEGGFTLASLRALVAARIDRIAPFRRRIVTVPFSLHHPLWVDDPAFDLDYHVRRVAVPAPGGPRELAEVVGDIASRQLDRTRPLWELWVTEGLENGHAAIIAKIHHAAIDGASGVDVLSALVDLEAQPAEPPEPAEWHAERVPTDLEMVVGSMVSIARQPVKMVKAVRNLTGSVVRLVTRIRRDPVQAGVPFTAPRLPFNANITPHRRVAFASAPLADVNLVRDAFGVTINDVVLAVVAGAMRRYLEDRGELPDVPLVAVIPTSVRSVDQQGNMGNRVSAMFTRLATELDDPVERLHAVRDVMSGAKLVHRDIGGETLEGLAELAAPGMLSGGARIYGQLRLAERLPPIYNLVVSNVPGPSFPLFMAGARLVGLYPMGPIFDGAGLNLTVLSYLDAIDIGLMACRETVPELWRLADAFPGALAELVKAAESG